MVEVVQDMETRGFWPFLSIGISQDLNTIKDVHLKVVKI